MRIVITTARSRGEVASYTGLARFGSTAAGTGDAERLVEVVHHAGAGAVVNASDWP